MRPAGRGELESLYFCYPTFEAAPVPELDGQRPRHPVAIVGGGPIGMTAALALARYGVRSVLIERKRTFNDGSRAICVARASFQILQQIGAIEPFLAKALGWRRGRSFYRGKEVLCFEMPHPEGEKPAGSRLVYDRDGAVAETFGAEPGSLYLLRPDLHIAGRWRELVPEEVVAQLKRALGLAP